MAEIDLLSSAGACALICCSMADAAARTFVRSSAEILFQAASVITVAPTSGASLMSSMCGASLKICSATAYTGGIGAALIAPVGSFNCLGISPAASGTAWKPFEVYHCTIFGLPSVV